MEMINLCCCCLLRPPDRDLKTPYTRVEIIEIYSDILQSCFQMHLILGHNGEFGICEECVGRLRDASDFKLQVQRSQAELQARLERALRLKEETLVKSEKSHEPGNDVIGEDIMLAIHSMNFEPELEEAEELQESDIKIETDQIKSESEIDIVEHGPTRPILAYLNYGGEHSWAPSEPGLVSPRDRQQLAMACSVRLERLRDDKAPHARHTRPRTSPHHKRLTTHMRVRAERDPDWTEPRHLTSKQFARKAVVKRLKTHAENKERSKQFGDKCNLVNRKRFAWITNYLASKLIHTGDKPHRCAICNKQLYSNYDLIRHSVPHNSTRRGHKPYSCDICSKKFSDKRGLSRHKPIHTGDKLYTCDICNKKFTQKSHLKEHNRFHAGRKPYSCDICSKKVRGSHLTQHRRVHTGGKPHATYVTRSLHKIPR